MLLLDSSSEDEKQPLRINEKFADRFQRKERLKDLSRAKDIQEDDAADESDSESESEDDEAELLSTNLDLKIYETITRIRKKDPVIYDKTVAWFDKSENSGDNNEDGSDNNREVKQLTSTKVRYKDVLREQLLSQVDNDNSDSDDDTNLQPKKEKSSSRFNYDKEQEEIRKSFLESVSKLDSVTAEEDLFGSDLPKKTSKQYRSKENEAIQKAIDEMEKLAPQEDESEKFLSNYMKNQLWKAKKPINKNESEEVASDYEDEENELDEVDKFESKYNFRFEELQENNADQGMQVIGHARNVEGSVRRKDERRKLEREQRKERKEKERRQKEAELRRLKNLKKEELRERLKKISDIGGLKELGFIDEDLLDEEWDPAKHEAMMQKQFNDQYYDEEDANFLADRNEDELLEHPEYVDEDLGFDDSQYFNYDENEYGEEEGEEEGEGGVEKEALSADARKQVGHLVDDLYKLDYEDIVAGIPCRFKYRSVEPDDFGLTAEEILLAEDSELNKFVSLKSISAYNTSKKGKDYSKKRKRLRAELRARMAELEEKEKQEATAVVDRVEATVRVKAQEVDANEGEKKKRRRRRKDRQEPAGTLAEDVPSLPVNVSSEEGTGQEQVVTSANAVLPENLKNGIGKKKKKLLPRSKDQSQSSKKAKAEDPVAKRLALYK